MLAVYGKRKEWKKFRGVDMRRNIFVVNRIYISLFPESMRDELEKEVKAMNELNPDCIFEIRKIK